MSKCCQHGDDCPDPNPDKCCFCGEKIGYVINWNLNKVKEEIENIQSQGKVK